MNTIVVAKREKPISPPVKAGLIVLLLLLMVLYFPLCLLVLAGLVGMLGLDLLFLLIMLRLYSPGAALPPLRRTWRLMQVVAGTFRSPREGAKYHIELSEAEAPHLFTTVRECARKVGCAEPDSIVLEMTCGAWVRLEGYRSGRGKSTLGLGFNLLAGLGQQEVEAIILHEMAHALLVQRGATKVGVQGVSRFIRLTRETRDLLGSTQPQQGEIWNHFWTAQLLARLSGMLAAAGVRLYALYSRQDEFDADRTSARLCGGNTFGEALLKSAMLDSKASEFDWQDCVMQSQREGSYIEWMRGKLKIQDEKELAKLRREAIDTDRRSQYNLHPTMEDRIAQVSEEASGKPFAISFAHTVPVPWFRDADATAERLFVLIEKAIMEQEREESANLSRWERKRRTRRNPNTMETVGVVVFLFGLFLLLVALVPNNESDAQNRFYFLFGALALLIIGVAVYRMGKPPEPDMLPVPDYALFEDSLEKLWASGQDTAPSLQTLPPGGGPAASAGRSERLQYWTERGQTSLQKCDYPTTLSSGLQALQANPANLEGMLLAGVAYNCLGQEAVGDRLLGQVVSVHPRSTAVRWAMAWACLATSNWTAAEAFMLGVVDKVPDNATLLACLALAQSQRGNLRQAIENMRRAVGLAPQSMRLRLRLVQYLLMAGKARDALPEVEAIEKFPNAQTDRDVQLALIRLHLMLNHRDKADAQAQVTMMQHPEPQTFFRIGTSYAMTEHYETATKHFHHATANALFPMAWVQLGFLHLKAERKLEARGCFLGAVNLFHPIAPKAEDQFEALSATLAGLRSLRDPSPTLFLWEITLDVRQLPAFKMAEFMLLVLAPNRNSAVGYAGELLGAMHPGGPHVEAILRYAEKADIEPPDSATEPGIVDWRGRR